MFTNSSSSSSRVAKERGGLLYIHMQDMTDDGRMKAAFEDNDFSKYFCK